MPLHHENDPQRLIKLFLKKAHSIFMDCTASLHPLKSHRMTGGERDTIKTFPSGCYFFLKNKHYRRPHLVIISVFNLRAALLSSQLSKVWSCDVIVSAVHICEEQHVCTFIRHTSLFFGVKRL